MKTSEVIVSDEGINEFNETIMRMAQDLESQMSAYDTIVKKIYTTAIVSGKVHQEWKLFSSSIAVLKGQFSIIASQVSRTNIQFIQKVDHDDKYLYN